MVVPTLPTPLKKIFRIGLCLLFLTLTVAAVPVKAAAQTQSWSGVCVASDTAEVGSGDVATIQGLQCLIANIFTVGLTLIGLAGFVLMLVGSFRYLISGGNAKGIESARGTIKFAIIGLVVALSSFIILNLISAFTGIGIIKTFVIPVVNEETGL